MKQKLFLFIAFLCALAGTASAENGWSVSNTSGSTFRIERSTSGTTETVKYRTVSLSAYPGQHYTAVSGQVTFDDNDTYKDVTVTEKTPAEDAYAYKYQDGTKRKYRFDVTDLGGFYLAHCDREITTGTSFSGSYVNKSVTDLVYFQSGSVMSGSGNKYLDVAHSGTNGTEKMIDDGYDYNDNTLCTISTGNLYNNNTALRTWLNSLSYKMYATIYFQQREVDDGYQYIQILADNASTYDGKDGDGKIDNGPTTSLYKAAFILTKNENVCTSWKYQAFPHRTDDHTSSTEFDYSDSYLYAQAFKSSSYRATTSGSLILDPTVNNINVRFDANGSGDDTWYLKNLKVRLALVDANAPTVISNSITVAPGRHSKGNTVYVSVAFNEIVQVTGTPTLTTTSANNWGSLSYVDGSGTNVLTFSKTIPANATGALNITGLNGTVKDLAGNSLTGSSVTATGLCSLDASYAYSITYNLNEGSVATANPTTYTYETATFTLTNPSKTGYTFDGWTGSNGDTPETNVTIATGSTGDKSYTANWTAHTYTVHFDANGGSGNMSDMSFTYDEAQNLTTNTFTRIGCTFAGWSTTPSGNVEYTDGQSVSNLTPDNGATVTLYANWTDFWGIDGGADGTEQHPYIITTTAGLDLLATYVNNGTSEFPDTYFKLGDNITYTHGDSDSENNYTAIGFSDRAFVGNFDGDGHTVSGIRIYKPDENYQGLFGRVYGATVKNVIINDARITGKQYVGGISGQMNGYPTIQNCLVLNTSITSVSSGGAVIGNIFNGTLNNNYYHNCSLTNNGTTKTTDIGVHNADLNGARSVHTLTLPDGITATGESVTYNNVTYYASNTTVTLSPVPGVNITGATYNDGSDHNASDNGDGTWSFTMPAADATVNATLSFSYIDADGSTQYCTEYTILSDENIPIDGNDRGTIGTSNQDTWYVATGNYTFNHERLEAKGHVHLILCDGATFTVSGLLYGIEAKSLTIYGQSEGTGSLVASTTIATNAQGAIRLYGPLTINGGNVRTSSVSGSGIVYGSDNGTITINGGNVNVTDGISGNVNITLGWTRASDRIYVSSYYIVGTISIKDGQTLYDGTNYYIGTLTNDEKTAIADKTLQPATLAEFIAYALPQTATNEYTISNEAGWTALCLALQDNDTYNRFSGKTVKLDTDISVTRKAGSTDHDFCGTFDGQGHTLTFNYTTTEGYAAPFRNVANGCVIKNLIVEGTITTSAKFAAGIASRQFGTVSIRNCRSSVTIQSSVKDDGTHGGLVAEIFNNSSAHLTIEGCVFDGKIVSTGTGNNATIKCGGLVGWRGNNGSLTITNSLYTPAALADGETWVGTDGSATFARNWTMPDNANCYYTQALGTAQGKQARRITAGEHVTVANAGNATEYNVSGITSYGTGIKYGNVLYAGSDDQVSLTLGHTYEGYDCTYTASAGTLSGDANPYTLTMPGANVTINATLVIVPIAELTVGSTTTSYKIDATNTTAEAALQAAIEAATNASGSTVTLLQDVTLAADSYIECEGSNYTLDLNSHSITGNNSDCVLELHGITITGGSITNTGSGKAITIYNNTNISGCTITGNTAISVSNGNLAATNCTIIGTSYGIMLTDDTRSCYLTINGCTITGNVGISFNTFDNNNIQSFIGNNTIKGCAFAGILINDNVKFKGLPHFGTGSDANGCDIVSVNEKTIEFQSTTQAGYYDVPATPITVKAVERDDSADAYVDNVVGAGYESYTFATNCNFIRYPNTSTTIPIEEVFRSLNTDYIVRTSLYAQSNATQLTKPIVLTDNADNTSTIEPYRGEDCAVTLQGRTLYKDGYWNTLCVPFDAYQISKTPLAGAEIRSLSSASLSADGTLTLNFSDPVPQYRGLTAGTPYIIKWTKAGDYVDDDAHNLVNPYFPSVNVFNENHDFTSTDGTVQFKGTYAPISFENTNRSILFMGGGNTLYHSGTGASINAFRAYFQLTDPSATVKAFNINFDGEDDPTSINSLTPALSEGEGAIYNVAGQRINKMQKGINIVNGKKVMK